MDADDEANFLALFSELRDLVEKLKNQRSALEKAKEINYKTDKQRERKLKYLESDVSKLQRSVRYKARDLRKKKVYYLKTYDDADLISRYLKPVREARPVSGLTAAQKSKLSKCANKRGIKIKY